MAILADAGEIEMAEQLHAQAGLLGPLPVADPATRAARIAADAAKYLQPVLGADAVRASPDLVRCRGVLNTALAVCLTVSAWWHTCCHPRTRVQG